jgi:putative transposase
MALPSAIGTRPVRIAVYGECSRRASGLVERLRRPAEYEEVYLGAYNTVSEARPCIRQYLGFYDGRRPHSSLDRQMPDQVCFTTLPLVAAGCQAGTPFIKPRTLFKQAEPALIPFTYV